MIDINLTGAWHACKAAIPHLGHQGRGGSIVIISSDAGLIGMQNIGHYVTAKHGLVDTGSRAGPPVHSSNSLHPTTVGTDMTLNDGTYRLFRPDLEAPTVDDAAEAFMRLNALPVKWVEPIDISNAVLFLASDEARYITGVTLPVDAGCAIK